MAAGLARALMGIGVRAVVAAGWPVNDTAAMVFAVTLHEQLTSGRTYGEAVARARAACADLSGTSWAAYQCYGDPTFVLRGRAHEPTLASVPVSLSDLKGRLGALRTRAADISRPKPGAGRVGPGARGDRREQLRTTFDQLSAWVTQTAYAGRPPVKLPPEVRRELALTARELADFKAAAQWYGTFAVVPPDGSPARPAGPHASALDLQQAANCLARSAQKEARLGRVEEVLDLFPKAESLAKGAIELLPQDEAWSILASVYKKWATVEADPARREAHLAAVVEAYEHLGSSTPGDYGVENRIQFVALRDRDRAIELDDLARQASAGGSADPQPGAAAPAPRVVDAAPPKTTTFWARAAAGDRELSRLMVASTDEDRQAAARRMVQGYADAFRRRSTFSERFSSWDHLKDLCDVLGEDDPRKPLVHNAWVELEGLMGVAPADPSSPPAGAPVGDAAPASHAQRGEASVELKAFPARSGECLLLEYTGNDKAKHRILVDGGLLSAFDDGIGTVLAPVGSVAKVDVAVVTHVDRDHLEGVLRALEDKRLDADDFWFNGRAQIADQGRAPDTRSTQQGDALSKLIPDGRRNLVVEGRALHVPESRPLRIPLPGGATAVLLSPSEKRLRALLKKWPASRGDAESVDELLDALKDDAVRGPGEFGKDHSTANGSSIAFLFEHDGASILFTADALAPELEASIRSLLTERGVAVLKVQLLKLPHHGSRQNITDSLLDLIEPEQILVCTDGSQFSHPDEDALEKVRAHYPDVPIHFTDSTELIRKRAQLVDMQAPTATPVVIAL
jgi:beta-lactamase superfamily II metal-dependent hydrolase